MAHVKNGNIQKMDPEDPFLLVPDKTKSQMDLETALQDSAKALDLFLNNRFSDALDLLRPWFRKKTNMVEAITEMFYKQPADDLTEEEMHAELCYAEALLQKAALTFLEESMISFIKGGIKIRNSFLIYKECDVMSTMAKNQSDQMSTQAHFRSGVNMGIGSFNLYLSLLPSKVLRLLEWMGFSGDRRLVVQEVGLSQLREGAASNSLRSILSTLCLLMYHLYISVILGTGEANLVESDVLLEPYIEKFPNGALILFYQARIALLKGNFEFAQKKFLECIAAQQEWRQIHHLCYWELMWSYSFQQDWLEAYQYADLLCKESKWSQALYVFQKASILSMMPEEEVKKTGENVEQLFRQVESLRLRIAGKSIPTEKFAAKKAQRYSAATPVTLVIPAVEMIYVWNGFTIVGKRPELTESILVTIKKAEEQLKNDPNPSEYHVDDQCMVQMLKGLCLRHLGRLDQAQLCFTQVISSENRIKHDHYLVPYSMYELGLLYKQQGDLGKATTTIENAKLNYKGYSMESRLHFRIHAALNTMGTSVAKLPPHHTSA
ncbi:tetratricopeptide repeat protein 39B isoform X4 [Salmo salar]|uniref:Tetratricopeptide repeat protein 39B n=2 Tax=Salmo salar TaxID=8030 RepID=A0ABM3F668_SALSA|nr:tetratricopeptide repeat protein 39B-like isoform X4 [Salmo salar]